MPLPRFCYSIPLSSPPLRRSPRRGPPGSWSCFAHRREADLPSRWTGRRNSRRHQAGRRGRQPTRGDPPLLPEPAERFDLVTIVGAPIGDDPRQRGSSSSTSSRPSQNRPSPKGTRHRSDCPPPSTSVPTTRGSCCSGSPRGASPLVQWITWQFAVAHLGLTASNPIAGRPGSDSARRRPRCHSPSSSAN